MDLVNILTPIQFIVYETYWLYAVGMIIFTIFQWEKIKEASNADLGNVEIKKVIYFKLEKILNLYKYFLYGILVFILSLLAFVVISFFSPLPVTSVLVPQNILNIAGIILILSGGYQFFMKIAKVIMMLSLVSLIYFIVAYFLSL